MAVSTAVEGFENVQDDCLFSSFFPERDKELGFYYGRRDRASRLRKERTIQESRAQNLARREEGHGSRPPREQLRLRAHSCLTSSTPFPWSLPCVAPYTFSIPPSSPTTQNPTTVQLKPQTPSSKSEPSFFSSFLLQSCSLWPCFRLTPLAISDHMAFSSPSGSLYIY